MREGWREVTLGEISNEVSYGYTESASNEKIGPKFLRITDIQGGVVNWENVPYCPISEKDLDKYKLAKGDIVVARTGNSTGENYIFDSDESAVYASYLIKFSLIDSVDSKFVWYTMRSNKWWDFIKGNKTGSAQAGANAKTLSNFEINLPPLAEQKAIAGILGKLDDKIELNRQMNQTLEEMAQALFQSWFVDFDPVLDNLPAGQAGALPDELKSKYEKRKAVPAEQKLKHTNPELAALFPNKFTFNEVVNKWIPEGWEDVTIEKLANVCSSKRIFAKEYQEEGVAFYRGKEISVLSQGGSVTSDIFITREKFKELEDNYGVPKKDDILLTSVGTIGNSYLVEDDDEFYFKDGNLTWFSKYKTEIRGKYLKTWFESKEAQNAIENIKIGTTQQAITISSLNSINLILANSEVVKLFNKEVESFIIKRQSLIKQTKTLTQLRDVLLPQLISGKLAVPEAMLEVEKELNLLG